MRLPLRVLDVVQRAVGVELVDRAVGLDELVGTAADGQRRPLVAGLGREAAVGLQAEVLGDAVVRR